MNRSVTSAGEASVSRPASASNPDLALVIGDLAHELVNPLNAAAMSTELAKLMLARGQYDKAGEALDRIGGDCMRCARILRDAQDYLTAAVNGRRPDVDPVELLDEAARLLGDRGEIVSAATRGAFAMEADPIALRRLFTELLRNAFDHGASKVDIRADEANGALRVRIADDGRGIEPIHLPRIFDPFFSTQRDRHSGVGLAIARRIALAHGGDIVAAATPDGAEFEVRLPVNA